MRKAIALSAAAALLVGIGCKNDRPASITTTTGAGIVNSDDAVYQLTARRCDREIDCKNVGAGKRYDDRGGCERELVHLLQVELGSTSCPFGLREERLDECLRAIRNESCASSLDTMDRLPSCRIPRLCIS